MPKSLHVAVLMGGWSAEREVSLSSGKGIAEALESLGHQVTRVDMDRNVAQVLTAIRPDVVFNALHGTPGEDGTVQGMLDLMQIPYTHSGVETSVIAIDKELTKMVLVPHGIRMPEGRIVRSESRSTRAPRSASPSSPTKAITATPSAAMWRGRGGSSTGCWPSPSSGGMSSPSPCSATRRWPSPS